MTKSAPTELLRPAPLREGDTVGIVAPASGFRRDDFEAGCATLRRLGYKPFFFNSIFEREQYFAGSVERRVGELHEMFERPEVRAILCARGGYGCNYLLPQLDLELIRAHPKIFAGSSDVTTLLTWLSDAAGLVTFHAPMVAGDFARPDGLDEESWLLAVSSETGYRRRFPADEVHAIRQGSATGQLYGGCLSLLVASLGTANEIRTEGRILFLEDRAESPYRIDRMLMQLKLAGKFEGVQGIVFGEMIDCHLPVSQSYSLQDVIMRVIGEFDVPVAFGLRSGHVSRQSITLPFGVDTTLTVAANVGLEFAAAVCGERAESRAPTR